MIEKERLGKYVHVKVPESWPTHILRLANQKGTNSSTIIRWAIKEYIEKENKAVKQ